MNGTKFEVEVGKVHLILYPLRHIYAHAYVTTTLKFLFRGNQIFNLGKLVVVIQTLRVEQSTTGLDNMAGDDLLYGELNLFEVDSGLKHINISIVCRVPSGIIDDALKHLQVSRGSRRHISARVASSSLS